MRSAAINRARATKESLPAAAWDSVVWLVSLVVAVQLRFEAAPPDLPFLSLVFLALIVLGSSLVFGVATQLYLNRYVVGSVDELFSLLSTTAGVVLLAGAINVLMGLGWGIPRSLVFIAAPFFLLLAGAFRLRGRRRRLAALHPGSGAKRAVVYGAGSAAETLLPQMLAARESPYIPVALLDDDPRKSNRQIAGVPTAGRWSDIKNVLDKYRAEVVVVAIPSASSVLLSRVYLTCRDLNVRVIVLPAIHQYLSGQTTLSGLREPVIEDLVGRSSLSFNTAPVEDLLCEATVLVTGAGGSIGAELVKQIAAVSPARLILLDRDESALLMALKGAERVQQGGRFTCVLCDVRDAESLDGIFRFYAPDVVFHAAALKHLTFLEEFPGEAWKSNVVGTRNVLEAAEAAGVKTFVNISTDKAADPVSVLGKSKLLAEKMTAWFGASTGQRYMSVRFGNVLGSRGSLIPLLTQQIDWGGPVEITDRDATRYFMSIDEACQLVLQSAAHGDAGDTLVLDMGEPVRIQEIAERLIELSGKRIEIQYTGLRPGEKLHESLFSFSEEVFPSQHSKIRKLRGPTLEPSRVVGFDQ